MDVSICIKFWIKKKKGTKMRVRFVIVRGKVTLH